MKVSTQLIDILKGEGFEKAIEEFAASQGLLPEGTSLSSERFLRRSIVPHVQRLSSLFNRIEGSTPLDVSAYWKKSSNPKNLRLAYFLYFMPCNLFRMASVLGELSRFGFQFPGGERAIEIGSGPGSGVAGGLLCQNTSILDARIKRWALVEKDRANLDLSVHWLENFSQFLEQPAKSFQKFHRRVDFEKPLLPPGAPVFDLWMMSYVLNETLSDDSKQIERIADSLLKSWREHLSQEGVAIMIEPALKQETRKILELRKRLISGFKGEFQILLPCLGMQNCGALENPEDWCHEEVSWWRPSYIRTIDRLAGLDRKTLPFSYLVICRSRRTVEEILPKIPRSQNRQRLVSPVFGKKISEFYACGKNGKERLQIKEASDLSRGSVFEGERDGKVVQKLISVLE